MRKPPEILIVEDNITTARVVELQVKKLGYGVVAVVASGEAALAQVAQRRPDLVLMDVMLDGVLDGIETAKELLRGGDPMPVVFLTARNDLTTIERIRGSLPFSCLNKPLQEDELATAIGVALRDHGLRRQVKRSQDHLALVLDVVADAVIALEHSGCVSFLNIAAEHLCGMDRTVAEGLRLDDVLPKLVTIEGQSEGSWERILDEGFSERSLMVRDGVEGTRAVRCVIKSISGGGDADAVTVIVLSTMATRSYDEVDRHQLQTEIRRMGRALKVLSETSRVLHSATSETQLFDEVCRLSVALGYRLAWIGMARHDDERTVEPVAQAGYHDHYLEEVRLTWGDDVEDEGPTGAAIRSGEMVIARDILADERYSDWRMEAAKRGYAAGISLPLKSGDRVVGALTIYAIEGDSFGADEVELLRELAQNISYGLLALRGRSERERVEQDLLKAEARYRALVEQIPVVTYVAAADDLGSRLYMSPQITTLTGFHPERWVSTPTFFADHLHPDDRVRVMHEIARCKDGMAPLTVEYRLLTSDGVVVWIRDEAKMVRDDDRSPFIHGVMMDISSRRLAEESLHHAHEALQAVINASPLAIFTLDPSGCVSAMWNQAAERLFGWHESEVRGRLLPMVTDEKRAESQMFLDRVLGGEIFTDVEIQRVHRDGRVLDLNMAAAPLTNPEGHIIGVIAMFVDISSRKQAEVALATAQRDATVGRMAAVVAHEINNPLAAIKAWLGLLHTDLAQVPEGRENLGMIAEQVDRIARTVRNLLGFARQREGREKRVPATVLIRTVASLFHGRMRTRGIFFTCVVPDDLPGIHGDNDQLQEVLINLLENASQALSPGRRCYIRAAVHHQCLEIEVEDDGPGLGADPERLFTPFYTTKVNGTGLGLSVARRICVAHGGSLTAENMDQGGARFRVTLPVLSRMEIP
jgi:PAS domain S-box-containing protein